jgi:hypothetical protein
VGERGEESSCRSLEKSREEKHRAVLGQMAVMEHAVGTRRAEWVETAATEMIVVRVEEVCARTLDEMCHFHLLQSAVKTVCAGLLGRLGREAVRSVALPPGPDSRHSDLRLP